MFCDQILYPPRPAGPSRKVGWIISTFLDIAKILKWNYLLVQKRPQEENYWKGQKKTQWSKKQLLLLNNLESIYNDLKTKTAFDEFIEKTDTKYIQVFDWLKLIDRNILIFFTLILFVASFNMISILLILIMERIRMIGILKALGSNNNQIKNIFLYNGLRLIFLGLFLGNLISITSVSYTHLTLPTKA